MRSSQSIFAVNKWFTTAFSLSLLTQISATSLIVWKIFNRSAFDMANKSRVHLSIIWMIIESGALLAGATLAIFILYTLNMNVGQIVTNIDAQLSVCDHPICSPMTDCFNIRVC